MNKSLYKLFPYSFGKPGETITSVIRLYNDMRLSKQMITQLLEEFNTVNIDALPPRLGQTVQIPVLLPFCFRHANEKNAFSEKVSD